MGPLPAEQMGEGQKVGELFTVRRHDAADVGDSLAKRELGEETSRSKLVLQPHCLFSAAMLNHGADKSNTLKHRRV